MISESLWITSKGCELGRSATAFVFDSTFKLVSARDETFVPTELARAATVTTLHTPIRALLDTLVDDKKLVFFPFITFDIEAM